jgi:transposase
MRAGIVVNVTQDDRRRLEAIIGDRNAPQKHVWRAKIILATADGCGTAEIMRRSGKAKPVVWRWQERFMLEGVAGLTRDKTRKPGKPPLPAATVQRVVDLALGPPLGEATHWTGRMLAEAAGVSLRSVQRILEARQLAPHRVRTFKVSNDAKFAEKLMDIDGLYVDPPEHAVVLSVYEKSQIQALDRTQPSLKRGRAGTITHDFKRHNTRTFIRRRPNLQMVSTTPPSIELSPIQRDMLDLIIRDQAAVQRAAEPERAILLWSQGVSETQTAHKLRITKKDVQFIRKRWWNARPRVTAAEKRLHTAFRSLANLIFRIPSEEAPSEHPLSEGTTADRSRANVSEATEIRPAARALMEILHHRPTNYGINRSNWSYGSLAEAYGNVYGRRPAKGTVGRLLRDAGLRWKKSRRVLTSPDPNYREKVELLLKTLHSLKVDEDLFFIDELGPLQVKRYGGHSYVSQGQTPTHPQAQRSKGSITLYAALSAKTNQVAWFYWKSKDSAGMINLAEIIFNQNLSKRKIYLTWDAASWHRSSQLVQWVDNFNEINAVGGLGPRIEFVPLPSSAQFLNVVEAVFSGMKRAVIHGSDYQSDKEMKMAISKHFCDRNQFFLTNPKRAGNKIWDIDFFQDYNRIRSGNYRKW